jgi:serine/tyrosine/threonine adenylyltransferase
MTLFFRTLALVDCTAPDVALFADTFYGAPSETHSESLSAWLSRYAAHLSTSTTDATTRIARMNAANPIYVLRNYLAQQAIDKAEVGDMSMVQQLLELLKRPYTPQTGMEAFAAKRPDWARNRAGCSMLSCSS